MNTQEAIVSGLKKLDKNGYLKSRALQFSGCIILILLSGINMVHATMTKKFKILPTIKAPTLLHINKEGTAQFVVKNLGLETVTLAMMPKKGVTQTSTGLLACSHPFTLLRGQKCLLNLKITGHKVGQKITHGPLICEATKKGQVKPVTSCAIPDLGEGLDITIIAAKKAIIAVKPQVLNIHAASVSPKMLTVINYSKVTAQNITVDLPDSWSDIKQNAKDCKEIKPYKSCKILFTANNAHPMQTMMVSGSNTTKVPVKIRVEFHNVKKFGPPGER